MNALNFCREAKIINEGWYGYALYTKRRLNYIRQNDALGWANHMGTGTSLSDLYKTSYVSHKTFKWLLDNGLIRAVHTPYYTAYYSSEIIEKYPYIFEKYEVY